MLGCGEGRNCDRDFRDFKVLNVFKDLSLELEEAGKPPFHGIDSADAIYRVPTSGIWELGSVVEVAGECFEGGRGGGGEFVAEVEEV